MIKKFVVDCWGPGDRTFKSLTERLKGLIFSPIIFILKKLGVTANMVSYASAAFGVAATFYLWQDWQISAWLIIISVLLDGIDGSLARRSANPDPRGPLIDNFADLIVISATTIGFIAVGIISPVVGGLYLVSYPLLIVFAIIRNIIGKPRQHVLRLRLYIYAAFILEAFWGISIMAYIVWPITLIHLFFVLSDFYFLKNEIK